MLWLHLAVGRTVCAHFPLPPVTNADPDSRMLRQRRQQRQPIIYVIEGPAEDLGEYGLIPWEEVDEWTEDEFLQF